MKAVIYRRVLLFWLLLLVLLFTLEQLIDIGVTKSSYSWYNKVNLVMEHKADPEIAVFGSSVGEVGIDVKEIQKQTGRSIYNFSIDGTRFQQYRGLISEFGQYSTRCSLVILVETFFSLTPVDQLTEVDRYMAHIDDKNIYGPLHSIQPDLVWKLRYVPFYKFTAMKHPYYKASMQGWRAYFSGSRATDTLNGYTPKFMSWQAGLDEQNRASKPMDITIDAGIRDNYRATVSELEKKGMKVLIILPPIYKDGLRLLNNLDGLRLELQSMASDQVYFRDYSNTQISNGKEYFYNNSHLNASGAKVFADLLSSDVRNLLHKN